ncbi:uncharacterized protein LKV04_007497 [Tautogolabrus adspersus]
MSLTKTKADGVTVITLTSDPQSLCPPFCQILKSRCYSPPCRVLSQHLKRVQGTSQSLLGALQIMIGLLNIGFGAIVTGNAPSWKMFNYLFPFWLGVMFIFFGAMCIVSEKYPIPWLVILTVILNLSGVGFAIAAIILNSLYMVSIDMRWLCEADYEYGHVMTPLETTMMEKCYEAEMMVLGLWRSIFLFLIVLSVLEFCIVISSAVLGIKALKITKKGENKSTGACRMSVTMTKADGVTMLTLTVDPQSSCPPICQILKGLCYSPVCCTVSQHLKRIQGATQSMLGAVQIMTGLLTIGLGLILLGSRIYPWWRTDPTMYQLWSGGLFIFLGAMCILSEKCPSRCLVVLNVILNLAGVAFAITTIVLSTINFSLLLLWEGGCNPNVYYSDYDYGYRQYNRPSLMSPEHKLKCLEGQAVLLMLLRSINAVLIVLSVLELCAVISSAVLGIKALRSSEKTDNKSPDDPEHKQLLEELFSNPPV